MRGNVSSPLPAHKARCIIDIGIFASDHYTERADALGVKIIRPEGGNGYGGHPIWIYATESNWVEKYRAVEEAVDAGYRVFPVIRADQPDPATGKTGAPPNWKAYPDQLERFIERWQPYGIAIENEAQAQKVGTKWRGPYCTISPKNYIKMMDLAAKVVSRYPGVILTDSGVEAGAMRGYLEQKANPKLVHSAWYDWCEGVLPKLKDAGCQYVNVHWYNPDASLIAPYTQRLTAITGLPVLSHELGIWKTKNGVPDPTGQANPAEVTAKLDAALAAGWQSVVWFAVDVHGKENEAVGLFESNGELNPCGIAFRDWVARHGA